MMLRAACASFNSSRVKPCLPVSASRRFRSYEQDIDQLILICKTQASASCTFNAELIYRDDTLYAILKMKICIIFLIQYFEV